MKYKRSTYQAGGGTGAAHGRRNAPPPPPPKPTWKDHAIDVGEYALNTLATPFETITGTNFYDPEFESDWMQNLSDINSAIVSTGTDIAGTMVAGPLYHAGKAGITKGSQALGLKDATHSGHNAWAEKTAATIGYAGDIAGVFAGGVADKGGPIKGQYGWSGERQTSPRYGVTTSTKEGTPTINLGTDMFRCWGGGCQDIGGGTWKSGFFSKLTPKFSTKTDIRGTSYEDFDPDAEGGVRSRLDLDYYPLFNRPAGVFFEGFGGGRIKSGDESEGEAFYGGKAGLQFKSRRPQKFPQLNLGRGRKTEQYAKFLPQSKLDIYADWENTRGLGLGADWRWGALNAGARYNPRTNKWDFLGGLGFGLEGGGHVKRKYQNKGKVNKYQFSGNINPSLLEGLNWEPGTYNLSPSQNPGLSLSGNTSGGLGTNLLNTPQLNTFGNFNVNPSNFGDAGTWGQNTIHPDLGGGQYSTTSDYWRPFSTEKGNLYRGIEGGDNLTNQDISLLTSKVNAGYDAEGNYFADISPNRYTGVDRMMDKIYKPFANQTAVGAQQYGDAMGQNFKTLFGKDQGNLMDRIGGLDTQSLGQTMQLANAGAGIINTWKKGSKTPSQLVKEAEDAMLASQNLDLYESGHFTERSQARGAQRGGKIGECKDCDKMKTKKYQSTGAVDFVKNFPKDIVSNMPVSNPGTIKPTDDSMSATMNRMADKIKNFSMAPGGTSHGAPTQFIAEATGIPSMLRLPQSIKTAVNDPSGQNVLDTIANTFGSVPGVGTGAKVLSKVGPKVLSKASTYIDEGIEGFKNLPVVNQAMKSFKTNKLADIMTRQQGGYTRPKMQNLGQMSPAIGQNLPDQLMPMFQKFFGPQGGTGDNSMFGNILGNIGGMFNPSNKPGIISNLPNQSYASNEMTQTKNIDELTRLIGGKRSVVGTDRTYNPDALHGQTKLGYDKEGVLGNLPKHHKMYKHFDRHLRSAENGGSLVDPNSSGDVDIEVEGGETIKTIDGQDKKFTGPSHDQGGIMTKANDGDFVYPKGTWAKRHTKRTERQAEILAKLEEAGINTEGLV